MLDIVSNICKLTGVKAKVMQDEKGIVYVYDCHHWSQECAYMLRFLCPDAVTSVESSVVSLSGFIVAVHQQPHSLSRRRMLIAIASTVVIYLGLFCFAFVQPGPFAFV
jgi:hypothetical protein